MNTQERLERIETAINNIGYAINSISELAKLISLISEVSKFINDEKVTKVNSELSIVRMQIDPLKDNPIC